jgi:Spirocyclase AveC-like
MLEIVIVIVSFVVAVIVVRGCVRERRLTFDAAFCLAGMLMWWADLNGSFINPQLLFSSNLVNVNSPLGHMPFVINKSMGIQPDPILFTIPIESFALLGVVMFVSGVARRLRSRYPAWSTARLIVTLAVASMLVEVAIEGTIVSLGLWTYTTPSGASLPLGGGRRLSIAEIAAGTCFWLLPSLLRMFKDDRGETLIERRLPKRPRVRGVVLFLAMYAFTEFLAWGPAVGPDYITSFYAQQWPKLPNYLVNDVCNAPGVTDSVYGACPGSPGYRMPGPFTGPTRPAPRSAPMNPGLNSARAFASGVTHAWMSTHPSG